LKIYNLTEDSEVYTSNVYLITGSWKGMNGINTLIDVGRDPSIIEKISRLSTGVGKKAVEQIILTHGHFEHAGLLGIIIEMFQPKVYAWSRNIPGVDFILEDGASLRIGDSDFEVIYTLGHSSYSICLGSEAGKNFFPVILQC